LNSEKPSLKEKLVILLDKFYLNSKKFWGVGKLKLEVTMLKQRKFLLQKEVGEEVHSLYKKGIFENLDLKTLLDKLSEIEKKIGELEEKISKDI